MAQSVVLQGVIDCTTTGNSLTLTSSGFGTPTAAIVFISNANTTNNPQTNEAISVGFWTAANSVCSGVFSQNAAADSNTGRQQKSGFVGNILGQGATGVVVANVDFTATTSGVTDGLKIVVGTTVSGVSRYVTVILFNSANVYAGEINLGTGTSAIDVTAPGFKPDIVFTSTVGVGDATINTNAILAFGAAHNSSTDTVTQCFVNFWDEDAQTVTDAGGYTSDTQVAGQFFNESLAWGASLSAFDASGFSITPSANAASDSVAYLAIKLADPDDAYVGVLTTPTSTGTAATTGTGFTPESVMFASSKVPTGSSSVTGGVLAIGVADDPANEHALFTWASDNLADSVAKSEYSATALHIPDSTGSDLAVASLSSFDADGWTLNYTTAPATARKFLAIAIGGSAGGTSTDLSIADTSHTHAADSIALTTDWLLSIADTVHTHSADGVTLNTDQVLAVADAVQDHAADIIALVLDTVLAPADSAHTHADDQIALDTTGAPTLAPADTAHTHAADALALTTDVWLAIADAVHSHLADAVGLTQADVLAILDAMQLHSAASVSLTFGDSIPVSIARTLVIIQELRALAIPHENRSLMI